ncbi:MAG: bifunctional 4-hydroxy-3-methylbut-2-enyl diphosphate reductase/30S ribosomal protein S1 [Phascolarctobacterium sp.]|nr:bifunctional 4-hydroxy-3-methylbut-2-enyl diphosphate reductase/30S ribosomal protein S1 [Phascolarctobacterium sp.]
MEIILAETLGFCYGVKRAVDLAQEAGKNKVNGATLGPLIHNPQLIAELAKQGIACYDDLSQFKPGQTVIIRSHGVGPETYENAKALGLDILDATCPNVRLAQKKAKECADAGYLPIIVGEKNHPEVKSILKWAGKNGICVETIEDTFNVPQSGRYGVVIQTTFELAKFEAILKSLQETHPGEYRVERTICLATSKRQQAAVEMAKQCSTVIVIGGKSSANTRHLLDLVKSICPNSYHVETYAELDPAWFKGSNKIGITAGASTPDRLIKEAYKAMEEMNFEQMLNAMEEVEVFPGKTIVGHVETMDNDGIYVSFGYRHEGLIPYAEWSNQTPEEIQATVKVGDEVEAQVMKSNTKTEFVRMSKIKAERDSAWKSVAPLAEGEKRTATVKVLRTIKNKAKGTVGLAVSVEGVEGFMPASHVNLKRVEDFEQYVGQELEAEIIEVDLDKKRIVTSRRDLLKAEAAASKKAREEAREARHQQYLAERQAKKEAAYEQVEEGQVYTGVVKKIAEFGLFVEIMDGLTGLVHNTELSWDRKVKPEDVAEVGQEVTVLVKSVDRDKDRVALSIKATQEDPWKVEASQFNVGDILEVEVVRFLQFGAIVKLNDKIEGLVHISEIAPQRIEKADDVLEMGQKVMAEIIKMDLDAKKIGLSINKVNKDAEKAEMRSFMGGKKGSLSQSIEIEAK